MTAFNFPNPDNPSEIAEKVSMKFLEKGYRLDFSILSLENEIDRILKNEPHENSEEKEILEAELTAYFGETICKIFNTEWTGQYFGALRRSGINYYSCIIKKNEFVFGPSHFFGYYFSNGSEKTKPFKDYVGDGLLKKIKNADK